MNTDLPTSVGTILNASPALQARGRVSLQQWETAVGRRVAARSRPERLADGTLMVTVSSSTWAQELSLLETKITARLCEQGLAVETLRFRIGAVDARLPLAETRPAVQPAPLPAELKGRLGQLEDEELKQLIASAAAHSLGRQQSDKNTQ